MEKIVLAFLAGASAALAVVVLAAVVFMSSKMNNPLSIAVHFIVFGTIIVFPLTLIGGVPLFGICRLLGWVNWWTVLLGSVALSEIYPFYVYLANHSGVVTGGEFATCAAAGVVAAVVFCRVAGIRLRETA